MTVVVNVKVPSALAPRLKLPIYDNATGLAEVGDGWEIVALPLGAAWLVGVAWLLCSAWVRKQCRRREAWLAVDDFGVPLWRCATGMWTQLLVLPTLFALSLACANFSLNGWVDAAGAAWFTVNGQRFWDWCFCYVFAGYMLEDMFLLRIGPMMMIHHIGCLVGLIFAFVICPSGFPYFSAGVIAFEFGSALLNLYCLYPQKRWTLWAYVSSMTCSNAAAGICCAAWLHQQFPLGAKAFSASVTCTFIVIRQKTCSDYVRQHRQAKRAMRELRRT